MCRDRFSRTRTLQDIPVNLFHCPDDEDWKNWAIHVLSLKMSKGMSRSGQIQSFKTYEELAMRLRQDCIRSHFVEWLLMSPIDWTGW